jgi:hypothetical protein
VRAAASHTAALAGTYGNAVTFNNAANSFTGNGNGLTSLNASRLTSGAVPPLALAGSGVSGQNTFEFGAGVPGKEPSAGKIGYQIFTLDALDIVGAGTTGSNRKIKFWNEGGAAFAGPVSATSFTGTGSNLTSLNASQLTSGIVPDARLSANVALRAGGNTFSGNQTITSGNVGIGTTTPNFPLSFLDVLGDKISLYGSSGNHFGFGIQSYQLQIHADSSLADIVFGYGQSAALTETLRIKGNGNVGIGTNDPAAKLQVIGDVKLGNNGQYFVPGGEENLRILRGSVSSAGVIINGSGFTATRTPPGTAGKYTITFTTGFSANPTVTVSCGAAGQTLASADSASVGSLSTTGFTVETGTRNIGYFDEPFSFIAIGPR